MADTDWSQTLAESMRKYQLNYSIGDMTPTVCTIGGVRIPKQNEAKSIQAVVNRAKEIFKNGVAEKILIYCPDAVGDIQRRNYPEDFLPVEKASDFMCPSASVMPSVTPVCYGTIFSGTPPEVHGIKKYEKPVLEVETLFDVFAEAGKNVAIVSGNECSIDRIFRRRQVDYYSFRTSKQVNHQTRELLHYSNYDLIVFYNGDYDKSLHRTGAYSPASLEKLRTAIQWYAELAELTDTAWRGYDRGMMFIPDHGGHNIEPERGSHGSDIAEDMIVNHFYRLRPGA